MDEGKSNQYQVRGEPVPRSAEICPHKAELVEKALRGEPGKSQVHTAPDGRTFLKKKVL